MLSELSELLLPKIVEKIVNFASDKQLGICVGVEFSINKSFMALKCRVFLIV